MAIFLRLNKSDEDLIREFARVNNCNLSEFIRETLISKIEDTIDLKIVKEFEEREKSGKVKYITADEMFKRVGID